MNELRDTKPLEEPRVFSFIPPHSNIQFNDKNYESTPLSRILSQCRVMNFKTTVIEKIASVGTSLEDDKELSQFYNYPIISEIHRLSFFNVEINSSDQIKEVSGGSFLGYAILKRYKSSIGYGPWKVFESVLTKPSHINRYVHPKKFKLMISNRRFSVRGILYAQQNGITNCCAHVALRTALTSSNQIEDVSYRAMNKILEDPGLPHKIKEGKSEGLNLEQIKTIILKNGFSYYDYEHDFKHKYKKRTIPIFSFQKCIYGSIESGLPALLAYSYKKDSGHVIPIFGHTFNRDTWVPNADMSYFKIGKDRRFVPSESWVSAYIGHDDNFGSNFCIPRHYPKKEELKTVHVIGFLPDWCQCNPIQAEAIAIEYLYNLIPHIKTEGNLFWNSKLKQIYKHWVVLRPILINHSQYLCHLEQLQGWDGAKISSKIISALKNKMDGKFWMVEISYPELFPANKRKLGEILLHAAIPPTIPPDYKSFYLARLPGYIYIYDNVSKRENCNFTNLPSGIKDHSAVFSF